MIRNLLGAFALGLLLLARSVYATEPDYISPLYDVIIKKDITYGQGRVFGVFNKNLKLDLYQPVGDTALSGRPAILLIHGGGFKSGSKNSGKLPGIAQDMASRGYVVANIDYRLAGDNPTPRNAVKALLGAPYLDVNDKPAVQSEKQVVVSAFEDARKALKWLDKKADTYNVDTARLVAYGISAGAIMSINVAYTMDDYEINTPRLAAVVDMYGAQLIDQSQLQVINSGDAPVFIAHGELDSTVPYFHGERIYRRAVEVGVPVEMHPMAGEKHTFSRFSEVELGVTIQDRILAFLKTALNEPASLPLQYCDGTGEVLCQNLQ